MTNILFEKYQGNGNDFIIIDSRDSKIYDDFLSKNLFNVKDLCNRNFGIGADGIIFVINCTDSNDAKMIIYNSDGSEAEMCGNGIRCLIKYLVDTSVNNKKTFKIDTNAGIKIAEYKNGFISVSMGEPILNPKLIPSIIQDYSKNIPYAFFKYDSFSSLGYAVGMGNPHLIFFVEDLEKINHTKIGPSLEKSELFPEKTNVHFCEIINSETINVKVWERGAGATLACGTGACAVHVAAYKLGLCKYQTTINLPGGALFIEWNDNHKEVIMKGEAKRIFKGDFLIK